MALERIFWTLTQKGWAQVKIKRRQPGVRRSPLIMAASVPDFSHAQASASAPGAAWVPGNADRAEEVPGKGDLSLQAETRAWVQKTQAHWLLLKTAPLWFHGFITRR